MIGFLKEQYHKSLLSFCAKYASIIKVRSLTNKIILKQQKRHKFAISERWFLEIFLLVTLPNGKTSARRFLVLYHYSSVATTVVNNFRDQYGAF